MPSDDSRGVCVCTNMKELIKIHASHLNVTPALLTPVGSGVILQLLLREEKSMLQLKFQKAYTKIRSPLPQCSRDSGLRERSRAACFISALRVMQCVCVSSNEEMSFSKVTGGGGYELSTFAMCMVSLDMTEIYHR